MPISFNFNPGAKKRRQEERDFELQKLREARQAEIFKQLLSSGSSPEDIKAIMGGISSSGQIDIPTTRMTPQGEVPVRFGEPKKRKGVFIKNRKGDYEWQYPPEGMDDFTIADMTLPNPPKPAKDIQEETQLEIAKKAMNDFLANPDSDETQIENIKAIAPKLGMSLQEVEKAKEHLFGLWKKPGKYVPVFGQAQQELPQEVLDVLQKASGKQVSFANGQVWKMENGKPVRVK